jgi:nitrate/TMAO reductase-like tetraheme cytochrome c subunit
MLAEDGDTSNSFLRLSTNKNSELCLSCHADKKTVIGTDHDLKHSTVDASNTLGQKQDVSGVCGQCHVPHNGEADAYLWAQQIGSGNDPIEQRCHSCHNPLGYAAHKNPELAKHPQQVNI